MVKSANLAKLLLLHPDIKVNINIGKDNKLMVLYIDCTDLSSNFEFRLSDYCDSIFDDAIITICNDTDYNFTIILDDNIRFSELAFEHLSLEGNIVINIEELTNNVEIVYNSFSLGKQYNYIKNNIIVDDYDRFIEYTLDDFFRKALSCFERLTLYEKTELKIDFNSYISEVCWDFNNVEKIILKYRDQVAKFFDSSLNKKLYRTLTQFYTDKEITDINREKYYGILICNNYSNCIEIDLENNPAWIVSVAYVYMQYFSGGDAELLNKEEKFLLG
jgi:hypothetical protein